jgi:hypothetical protein
MKKRFYLVVALIFLAATLVGTAAEAPRNSPDDIRAVYLSSGSTGSEAKVAYIEKILTTTRANGLVIDFKDSGQVNTARMAELVKRFKKHNTYLIARIVTLQDTYFAKKHPEVAIKTPDGDFWYSGRKVWNRYWLDPASTLAQDYNIAVAKQAIDLGFDEIQFDYIRFPTDGNMRDIRYPVYDGKSDKCAVMRGFFKKIHDELKAYSPQTMLAIDVFGEVLNYGRVSGIGQDFPDVVEYFDVVCPMAYPSHYQCGEFGLKDPNTNPYKVYYDTLRKGKARLPQDSQAIFRSWVQDFSIPNIYQCGPKVIYTRELVRDQIQAGRDNGAKGFMLWNASNNYTLGAFEPFDKDE